MTDQADDGGADDGERAVRAARAEQGGEPRSVAQGRAHRVRRDGLWRRRRARHRAPHRPRLRHLLQLLQGQGRDLRGRGARDDRRADAAPSRRPRQGAHGRGILPQPYLDLHQLRGQRSRRSWRSAATTSRRSALLFEKSDLQSMARQLSRTYRRDRARRAAERRSAYLGAALSGVVFEISVAMVARDPIDTEAAIEFATRLMMGGIANLPKTGLSSRLIN